jgi:acetylornithine deacetylase/succinyl-diaminopimelate desuccinylase-like protein
VVPAEVHLRLDWRHVPGETPESIIARLQPLLDRSLLDGCRAEITLPSRTYRTWTGGQFPVETVHPPFVLAEDHPLAVAASAALSDLYRKPVVPERWRFATDAGHLMAAGIPCIGFGPGDETLVHTAREHIAVVDLVQAMAGNMALAIACASLPASGLSTA